MRVKNSIKNIYISVLTQIIIALLGFVSRRVFVSSLGTEYLGVNGLLSNILSMLSLAEGGIGVSIVYNLYKPLAKDDKPKIIALVQLYKKIYGILSIGIFAISLVIYPIVLNLINKDVTVSGITIVYFIFVFKNMVSYLNAHKWSLINADQKGYVLSKYNLIFNIITTISKIIVLKYTQNYILYLLIEVLIFIAQNIWNGKIVNSRYSYIKTKDKYNIDYEIKQNLIKNVKALFLHNIGSYCVFGTDNILISALINIKSVGLYSNYVMVIAQLRGILTPILNGISNSVGNLIATESKEKSYQIFKVVNLMNFWIYSFCTICLFNLLEPFITWWLGDGLLLDKLTLIVLLINFYITGMRSSINIFKSKAGIFSEDKFVPVIEAVINLGASIILAKYFGLAGIFMGTTISTVIMPLWIQSKLTYNKVFNKSVTQYFKVYIYYILLTVFTGMITTSICNRVALLNDFSELIIKGLICLIVPNLIYTCVYFNSEELKYVFNIMKPMLNRLRLKLKKA